MDATPRNPEGSLELIRQHCDNGLRYFTWALERMPSIPDQATHVDLVQDLRSVVLVGVVGAGVVGSVGFIRSTK